MKNKPVLVMLGVVLVVAGSLLGTTIGRFLPSLGVGGVGSVQAQVLDVQPTAPLVPVGNGFTYQGRLKNGRNPANGSHDFTFKLFD